MKLKFEAVSILLTLALLCVIGVVSHASGDQDAASCLSEDGKYIKWVDFNVTTKAMSQALKYDLDTYGKEIHLNWIDLLAYAGAKNGGKFAQKACDDIDRAANLLTQGETVESITQKLEYFSYYQEAYTAVLGGFVGEYSLDEGNDSLTQKYGLKVFSPIAKNYGFAHYDDFGNSRSYGYRRRHLGNDLLTEVGTPIIAVEGGVVEEMGWNQYGGWRVGIRSFDGKRYWYYAHMRKDHPFHYSLSQGQTVQAGEVIGYVGMTGYSSKENVNGMQKPHLHFGLQLIFDESQKDGNGEIWVDVYQIVELLQRNTSRVIKNAETKDYDAQTKVFPIAAK